MMSLRSDDDMNLAGTKGATDQEVAEALGVAIVKGPFGRMLRRLRDRAELGAAATVVPGALMADRLAMAVGDLFLGALEERA